MIGRLQLWQKLRRAGLGLAGFWLSACSPASDPSQQAIDAAKLEQVRRILNEQEQGSPGPAPTPTASPTPYNGNELVRLAVRPESLRLTEGTTLEFRVLAIRRDSRETSLDQGVSFALQQANLATLIDAPDSARFEIKGLVPGSTELKLSYQGLSLDVRVEVLAKELLSLEIIPKSALLGSATRFSLVASYDNGQQEAMSGAVRWESTDSLAFTFAGTSVDPSVFMARKIGVYGIRAFYAGSTIISRTRIQMPRLKALRIENDGQSLKVGSFVALKALATFANDEEFDISSSVQWSSSDTSLAAVDSTGVLEAKGVGDVTIRAVYEGFAAETEFNLNDTSYQSYQLEPSSLAVPVGMNGSFALYGVQANGSRTPLTSSLQIRIDDPSLVQLGGLEPPEQKGQVGGISKGQTTIRLRYGQRHWTLPVEVIDAVPRELSISSPQADGPCGVHQPRFSAEATLSDGSKRDVTAEVNWSVEPANYGVASNAQDETRGTITTSAPGNAAAVASLTGFDNQTLRASAPIKIGPAVILGLEIRAPEASLAIGESMPLSVSTQLSCGVGTDLTNQVTWSSADNSLLEVSNLAGTRGLLTTKGSLNSPRTIEVRAEKTDWSGTLGIELRPKEIKQISIRPLLNQIVVNGQSTSHVVEARYSDTTVADITNLSGMTGYSLQYALTDCAGGPCASMDASSGQLTAGAIEGLVRPFVTLTAPDGRTLTSAKASVKVVSKCEGGVRAGFYCVSRGAPGLSCNEVCEARQATYHSATHSFFGKAGDLNECSMALKAVGYTPGLEVSSFRNTNPVGCAIYFIPALNIKQGVREVSNDTTAEAAGPNFERLCACRE